MQIQHIPDLEVFVQIVDRGSLVDAARTLGVTKNAVTRRLARLESQLGKPLLARTTRTVSLTEDGRQFYRHCQRILSEVLLAEDALIETGTLRGTLRVGIPTRLLHEKSLLRIDRFLQEHSRLELQIIGSDQPFRLLEQRIDVAIAVGPQPDSSLLQRRLFSFADLGLAATAAYLDRRGRPKRLRDLKHHQCLKFQTEHPQRQWTLVGADGNEHEVPVGGTFSSNDSRVLDTAMRSGMGIGILSKLELRALKKAGKLVPVLPKYQFAPFPVSVVYQRQAGRARRLDPVLELLSEVATMA